MPLLTVCGCCTYIFDHTSSSLVAQLARDLQSDFYLYFSTLFPHLMALSNVHDPQVIQVRGGTVQKLATLRVHIIPTM